MDKKTGFIIGIGSATFLIVNGLIGQKDLSNKAIVATVIGGLIGGALTAFIAVFILNRLNKMKKE